MIEMTIMGVTLVFCLWGIFGVLKDDE